MQLLTLAGFLFLAFYSAAAQSAESVGPCTKARQDAGPSMPGKYVPQCTEYGFFQSTQCHGSIGRCWCVVPDTGKPVDGSSLFRAGDPQCTICLVKRSQALRPTGTVGNFVPQCDDEGLFVPTQVWGSTGQSWCVNRFTGEEVQGTRSGPGPRGVNCTALATLAGLGMYKALDQQGPCYAKTVEARGRESMPGFYLPGCTNNGYYHTEQRHSSTGYSWCVNPATGAEVPGTRRSPAEPQANCGACFKEIEEKLSRRPALGQELPQCNPENGDYLPVQHREGYSFCVNPTTGSVEGKKNAPGDKTPLPCVNLNLVQLAPKSGACAKEVEEKRSQKPILGQDLPQCNPENGDYLPVQYREGWSFCVNPKTGAVEGKKNPPGDRSPLPCVNPNLSLVAQSGACAKEVAEKRSRKPMLGQDLPQYNPENGDYLPVQYREGWSFCVNPKTGAVEGKKNPPGDRAPLPCVNPVVMLQSQGGACAKEVAEKRSRKPMLGQELPQCNPENGDYLPVQYQEGYSFCVNPKTGAVEGKKNPPGDNTPLPCVNPVVLLKTSTGACAKEVEEKRSRKPLLGQQLPQCNAENGDYLPVQHREGYSFCVNPQTGAVEGKVYPPGDNTPLPCVNH